MAETTPRYRQLADLLRADISEGRWPPGSAIPTEMELCDEHQVSRHTAREALRILTEAGYIERRRGAGSIVLARQPATFSQSVSDFDSLLQYARNARLRLEAARSADELELDQRGLTGPYRVLSGLRRVKNEPPQALTRVFIRRDCAPDLVTAQTIEGSISEWVEATQGPRVVAVTQRMEAIALDRTSAQALSAEPGSPALKTVRRYRDAQGDIIIYSESLHPAGRFAYEMRLNRS